MANSSFIGKAKKQIIKEFIKDKEIINAINSSSVTSAENLINTHIFNYHQNPNTLNTVETFITIQVHIPQMYSYYNKSNNIFVNPTIEIWIISHSNHMVVDNIPKITENRNDYLSKLIDKKLNGRSDFGIGELKLVSNIEGAYQTDYVYRTLIFEAIDINNSLCEDE